jgi:hypothetical protein
MWEGSTTNISANRSCRQHSGPSLQFHQTGKALSSDHHNENRPGALEMAAWELVMGQEV